MLEAIIKASPLAIIAVDAEDRITLWNESAERMFGWNEEEVLGQALPILPPEAEDLPIRKRATFRPSARNRVRSDPEGWHPVPVSIWTAPIASNGGRLTVLADLTQLREAERSARRSHGKRTRGARACGRGPALLAAARSRARCDSRGGSAQAELS